MGRKKEKLYLAYGSNMNQTQMAFRCPTAKVVGTSELKGYELLFKGGRRGAVATVEPKEGSSVPVLLWKIRQADEEALDRYEGYPRFYEKQMLQVELEGKEVSVMGYVMTPGHEYGIPSDGYADVMAGLSGEPEKLPDKCAGGDTGDAPVHVRVRDTQQERRTA